MTLYSFNCKVINMSMRKEESDELQLTCKLKRFSRSIVRAGEQLDIQKSVQENRRETKISVPRVLLLWTGDESVSIDLTVHPSSTFISHFLYSSCTRCFVEMQLAAIHVAQRRGDKSSVKQRLCLESLQVTSSTSSHYLLFLGHSLLAT